MRNTKGMSKTEQVARWSMDIELGITAQMVADKFGWPLSDAQRRLQDIQHSNRYSWSAIHVPVRKSGRTYKVLVLTVYAVRRDPKAAEPLIAVSRNKDGDVIEIRRFRSGYAAVDEGFEHTSVLEAAKGLRRDHMHAGFAWRYACADKHALATIEHAAKYKYLSGAFNRIDLETYIINPNKEEV